MTSDAILVIRTLFGSIWRLFTSWYIPGTNVTPASWHFLALTLVLVISILRILFGFGGKDG